MVRFVRASRVVERVTNVRGGGAAPASSREVAKILYDQKSDETAYHMGLLDPLTRQDMPPLCSGNPPGRKMIKKNIIPSMGEIQIYNDREKKMASSGLLVNSGDYRNE
jgi:hypothetical protein